MLLSAFRSIRSQPICRKASGVRFFPNSAGTTLPEKGGQMDATAQQVKADKSIDSFGEGYASRADEEGFGGTFGENQKLPKKEEDKIVNANVPEYDTSQGSHVKETEKARHQQHVDP